MASRFPRDPASRNASLVAAGGVGIARFPGSRVKVDVSQEGMAGSSVLRGGASSQQPGEPLKAGNATFPAARVPTARVNACTDAGFSLKLSFGPYFLFPPLWLHPLKNWPANSAVQNYIYIKKGKTPIFGASLRKHLLGAVFQPALPSISRRVLGASSDLLESRYITSPAFPPSIKERS